MGGEWWVVGGEWWVVGGGCVAVVVVVLWLDRGTMNWETSWSLAQ